MCFDSDVLQRRSPCVSPINTLSEMSKFVIYIVQITILASRCLIISTDCGCMIKRSKNDILNAISYDGMVRDNFREDENCQTIQSWSMFEEMSKIEEGNFKVDTCVVTHSNVN